MTLVGFYIGNHDSNISIFTDGIVKYLKSERVNGIKHHQADLNYFKDILKKWNITQIDAIAFSDGNRNGLGCCEPNQFYKQIDPLFDNIETFCIDHHYSHILSAWPLINMDQVNIGVAIDGRGDNNFRTAIIKNPGTLNPQYKYVTQKRGIPFFFNTLGNLSHLTGNYLDYAGKLMGAQAYGKIDYEYVNRIKCSEIGEYVYDLISKIQWRGEVPLNTSEFFNFNNQSFLDWLATVHYVLECYVIDLFKSYCDKDQFIVYSGGCAQNTVFNEKLFEMFPNLVIPPHCYDGGQSLGCLEFLRIYHSLAPFSPEGFPYWQNDIENSKPDSNTIGKVSELLSNGKIVGWYQGRGEIGPRALGHRSILMDCRNKNAKDILNQRIKHREPWRPYAPSILESQANKWFNIDRPSPYMLRAVTVKGEKMDIIPSVVHVDGTSRIQTVAKNSDINDSYFKLLEDFYSLTGVPMLLNTSLNAGGSPIFGSQEQCIDLYKSVPLDAICMGNQLLIKE